MSEHLRFLSRYGWLLLAIACCAGPVAPRPAPSSTQQASICERPALPPRDVADANVNASFRAFARSWIEKLRRTDAGGMTRRRIPDALELELRPTGSKTAPYVGILRYCAETVRCAACASSKSTAVTEIFRYQDGVWVY